LDDFFLRTVQLDINAAVIGIGRARWVALRPDEAQISHAVEIMHTYRFDVLPIDPGPAAPISDYFHATVTNTWTSETVLRSTLTEDDSLPADTPIQELITHFAETRRRFFFLTHEGQVAGLVSLANLNARVVQVWLFSLLAEFEVRLSRLVSTQLSEEALRQAVKNPEVIDRFDTDRERGVENALTEYLYLADLLTVVRARALHQALDYSGTQFDKLGGLNELRKQVMHPVRSLITSPDSIMTLASRLRRLYDALCRLRSLQGGE
jgi:hypothetical protein